MPTHCHTCTCAPGERPPPTARPSSGTTYSLGGPPPAATVWALVAVLAGVVGLALLLGGCTEPVPGYCGDDDCNDGDGGALAGVDTDDQTGGRDTSDPGTLGENVARGTGGRRGQGHDADGDGAPDAGALADDDCDGGADAVSGFATAGEDAGADDAAGCPGAWECELRGRCDGPGSLLVEVAGAWCGAGGTWRFDFGADCPAVDLAGCGFASAVATGCGGAEILVTHTPCGGGDPCYLWTAPCR